MFQARSLLDKLGDPPMSNTADVRGPIFVGNEIHKPLERANDAAETHALGESNARAVREKLTRTRAYKECILLSSRSHQSPLIFSNPYRLRSPRRRSPGFTHLH